MKMHLNKCKMDGGVIFLDKKVLREYLEKVRLLENDVYTMNEAIGLMESSRRKLPDYHPPVKPAPSYVPKPNLPSKAGTVIGTILHCYPLLFPGFIFLYSRIRRTKKIKEQYEIKLQECQSAYDQAIALYESRFADYKKAFEQEKSSVEFYNKGIDQQIATVVKNRSLTQETLRKLYSLNIIYHKYRSIVPITMFCEYIDSGIRQELHGANGMYDLYEQQLLGKHIVGELTTINSGLRRIGDQLASISSQLTGMQRNQALLYEEIARGNTIACKIAESTQKAIANCETHLANIRSSAEMTAFNTEAAARRTDAIARIAEYEFAANHSPYLRP